MEIIFFFISLGTSIIGAISGIGGGIMIKPVLDAMKVFDTATISFLSGCTVLAMTMISLYRSRNSEVKINKYQGTFLAIGSALGGIVGKNIFDYLKTAYGNDAVVGSCQSVILIIMTIGVFVFTQYKSKVKSYTIQNQVASFLIGAGLGALSAFLGIGGGPINLAILYLCFSMDSKTAALNSLYIIFFSQVASLMFTLVTGSLPTYSIAILALMIAGGFIGGFVGSSLFKKMSTRSVDRLFSGVLIIITCICTYNLVCYIKM